LGDVVERTFAASPIARRINWSLSDTVVPLYDLTAGPDPPGCRKLLAVGIFTVNEGDLEWSTYESDSGPAAIRFKALTYGAAGVPGVQYIEYGPGRTDPVHQHDVDEFFIVTTGELWLDDVRLEPGGIVFIPAGTDYAVRAGDEGVRYFRVVTS